MWNVQGEAPTEATPEGSLVDTDEVMYSDTTLKEESPFWQAMKDAFQVQDVDTAAEGTSTFFKVHLHMYVQLLRHSFTL